MEGNVTSMLEGIKEDIRELRVKLDATHDAVIKLQMRPMPGELPICVACLEKVTRHEKALEEIETLVIGLRMDKKWIMGALAVVIVVANFVAPVVLKSLKLVP